MIPPVPSDDELITITATDLEVGGARYPLKDIKAVERRNGTLMEEKIFFYILEFFFVAIIVIGLFAGFYIYSLLGFILTLVVIYILKLDCQMIVVNDQGRHIVLRHKDVKTVIRLKGRIDEAVAAIHKPPAP